MTTSQTDRADERSIDDSGRALPRARWWRDGFRPLLARLHFFIGVFVGPFILIAAVTGLMYAATPAIEQIVYRDTLTVAPSGSPLPLAQQVSAAQEAQVDGTLIEVRPATRPDDVTRVTFSTESDPADRDLTVFINPYSGEVTNTLPTFGEWLPVRSWFDDLHRTLFLGDIGRLYSELAASWLWVLAASGLSIWIFRRVRKGRRRTLVIPTRRAKGRARLMGWHGALGVWLALGMIFLSATGLTWSQYAGTNVGNLREALDWTTPSAAAALPENTEVPEIPERELPAALERAAESARDEGLDGIIKIVPAERGEAWTVSQAQRSWPEKQDSISVNPATGQVLSRVDFADWPLAAKLARWGVDAHMGLLFGAANQIVLGALAIGIIFMILLGYRMWWLRRPTARAARSSYLRPPGAGRTPTRVAIFMIALLGVGAGLFAPALGGSLILFLAVDLALGAFIRRRASRPDSTERKHSSASVG